jgi:hypothetical protein
MRKQRQKFGREPRYLIDKSFAPLCIRSDTIAIAADWHIPFYDRNFAAEFIITCEDQGIRELIIPGDLWDCDNYSKFVHLGWRDCFRAEIDEVRSVMVELIEHFDKIYLCRGNHEKRWIDGNFGMMGMRELFALLELPPRSYTVTLDDHMYLESNGKEWLIAHPRSFRQTPCSVARVLANKYLTNVCTAHGHQWEQGISTGGHFDVMDAGGMFDPYALEYLRQTNTYPAVQGGFYLIIDGKAEGYRNDGPKHKIGGRKK